jgi:hypothetical protein
VPAAPRTDLYVRCYRIRLLPWIETRKPHLGVGMQPPQRAEPEVPHRRSELLKAVVLVQILDPLLEAPTYASHVTPSIRSGLPPDCR